MKPIQKTEPVDAGTVKTIAGIIGPVGAMIAGLGKVDLTAGAGIIDGSTKCLWDNDGHRIEIFICSDGGYGASRSKVPDPDCPVK